MMSFAKSLAISFIMLVLVMSAALILVAAYFTDDRTLAWLGGAVLTVPVLWAIWLELRARRDDRISGRVS